MRRQKTIRNQLYRLLVVQLVILALFSSGIVYIEVTSANQQSRMRIEQLLEKINGQLDGYAQNMEKISAFPIMRDLKGISTPLYKVFSEDENYTTFPYELAAYFENTAAEIMNLHQAVERICVVNLSGYGFYVDRASLWGNSTVYSMDMSKLWIEKTLNRKGKAMPLFLLPNDAFGKNDGTAYLYCARAIVNAEKYKTVGLSLIGVSLGAVQRIFETEKLYDGQELLLIAPDGTVEFGRYVGRKLSDLGEKVSDGVMQLKEGKERFTLTFISDRGNHQLGAAIITPSRAFTKLFRAYYSAFYWAIVVMTAITLVVYSHIIRSVQQPIKELVDAVQAYSRGQLDIQTNVRGAAEVRVLGDALNDMSRKIEGLIEEVSAQKLEKTEYELRVLRSQINPHFLYNALEAMRMRAYLNQDDGVEQIASNLAAVLRYGLNTSHKPVTLQGELENVRTYMKVVNACSANPTMFNVYVQPELLNCMMPRMTLQPIVENCIKHGFAKGTKAGTISVYGYDEGNDVILQITDDGCGMSAEQLEALQSEIKHGPHENGEGKRSQHIGLYNVNRRIAILMGAQYGLNVKTVQGRGMSVMIRLPFAADEEENHDPNFIG